MSVARCAYCGRYGSLGSCEGCGAPNRPVADPMILLSPRVLTPTEVRQQYDALDVTTFDDLAPRFIMVKR